MKTSRLLSVSILFICTILFSCKKQATDIASNDIETTFELSSDQAIADNLMEDANNIFMEAAANKNLLGSNFSAAPVVTSNILNCATVTVSPSAGFPKTIVIDFNAGNCTAANGINRRGKINITLSDSVRRTGSKAVFTFTDYYVSNYKKEGTLTWTNTSTASTRSWQRVVTGKVVAPSGAYWTHSGTRDVVQIDGALTPTNLLDDVYLITGNHKVTSASGKTRDCFITEALQKQTSCDNIGTGKLKVQGGANNAVIDFGNGDCDKLATISIGGEARTIVLR